MTSRRSRSLTLPALLTVAAIWPGLASAQVVSPAAQAAPTPPAQPVRQPPEGTGALVRTIELAFPRQGNTSVIEPQTYLYYLQTKPSRPSDGVWVAYDEQSVLGDFRRLWNTNFLDDLWIDVRDVPYPNGVIGKYIVFIMEERQRVKIVEYVGSKKLEATKIDEKLKEKGAQIRLDSFIDPALVPGHPLCKGGALFMPSSPLEGKDTNQNRLLCVIAACPQSF